MHRAGIQHSKEDFHRLVRRYAGIAMELFHGDYLFSPDAHRPDQFR